MWAWDKCPEVMYQAGSQSKQTTPSGWETEKSLRNGNITKVRKGKVLRDGMHQGQWRQRAGAPWSQRRRKQAQKEVRAKDHSLDRGCGFAWGPQPACSRSPGREPGEQTPWPHPPPPSAPPVVVVVVSYWQRPNQNAGTVLPISLQGRGREGQS